MQKFGITLKKNLGKRDLFEISERLKSFNFEVIMKCSDMRNINCKSILGLLSACPKKGDSLIISINNSQNYYEDLRAVQNVFIEFSESMMNINA